MVPAAVVEMVPVRVVEMVPAAVVEMVPALVVEMVPALVVEMVPALVVEIVPPLENAVTERENVKSTAAKVDLNFMIFSWSSQSGVVGRLTRTCLRSHSLLGRPLQIAHRSLVSFTTAVPNSEFLAYCSLS
jgi:hypothetical protein